MTEKREVWLKYPAGGLKDSRINLYDSEKLIDFLSAGGTKMPVWDGDLDISDCGLEQLPDLSRIEVAGIFDVSHNRIKTMKGSPYRVGGDYLANGTLLGVKIEEEFDSRAFMEGFPQKGIGGNLQIMLTHVDGECGYEQEERAEAVAIVQELQRHVGGKVWTSGILWDERNRLSEQMCATQWNDPKRAELMQESVFLGHLVDQMMKKTPAAEARERAAIKNIRAENKKYQEKRCPKTAQPEKKDSRAEKFIRRDIHEWANQTIEEIREKLNENYDSYSDSKRHLSHKKVEALEKQRRILLVKLFVLSEVIKINQSEREKKVASESVALWNRAKQSFGADNKMAHGEELSLKGLENRADILWKRTRAAFGLNKASGRTR